MTLSIKEGITTAKDIGFYDITLTLKESDTTNNLKKNYKIQLKVEELRPVYKVSREVSCSTQFNDNQGTWLFECESCQEGETFICHFVDGK